MNSHEVDGDPGQHDDHSQTADHRLGIQTEAQQHGPEDHVGDGDQQVYLHGGRKNACVQWTQVNVHTPLPAGGAKHSHYGPQVSGKDKMKNRISPDKVEIVVSRNLHFT